MTTQRDPEVATGHGRLGTPASRVGLRPIFGYNGGTMRILAACGALLVMAVTVPMLVVGLDAPHAGAQPERSAPPIDVDVDYQLGGAYRPVDSVGVVSRDWYSGGALRRGGYSICYVNAFQTQGDIPGIERPDEQGNWPRRLVFWKAGQDPNWPGEFPIDIRTPAKRKRAANWVKQMVQTCADKGFDAVEFDNLDTWTRFRDIEGVNRPIRKRHAVQYAKRLVRHAHSLGLAVGQKNSSLLTARQSLERIGFDFVVAEECGTYRECDRYTRVFGDRVLAIEYDTESFAYTCNEIGDRVAVVLRDVFLRPRGTEGYVFDTC